MEFVCDGVGVGVGDEEELQPPRRSPNAVTEVTKIADRLALVIWQIYPANLGVGKDRVTVESHSCSISQESAFW
jgi:hypothetical protein